MKQSLRNSNQSSSEGKRGREATATDENHTIISFVGNATKFLAGFILRRQPSLLGKSVEFTTVPDPVRFVSIISLWDRLEHTLSVNPAKVNFVLITSSPREVGFARVVQFQNLLSNL